MKFADVNKRTLTDMKFFLILNVSFLLLFALCTMRKPADSRAFHSDPAHLGIYQAPELDSLGKLNWRFKTEGRIFSSPAVMDGIVYIGSEDSNLYAVNAETGALIWKFKTGGQVSSSPAVYKQTVYFTSYDGHCYAVDVITGKEKWNFKTGGEKKVEVPLACGQ